MIKFAKNIIKKVLPESVKENLRSTMLFIKIIQVHFYHQHALKKVSKKDKIKVVFFLIHDSVWKCETIYYLMKKDNRFEPIVIVCPYILYGEEIMLRDMNQAFSSFEAKGYNVLKSYNETTNKWMDVKKEINPDIIFFTNPHHLTKEEYYITNYTDCLTCYVPYGFKNSYLHQFHYNGQTQNLVWKFFLETEIHKKLSKQYAQNKGINTLVTGYPGLDVFFSQDYQPVDVWKIKNKKIKRIIWAPHHTIPWIGETLNYATFLKYADFMLEIAEIYKEKIQIAFKPHPLLRAKLSKEHIWGKEKTDDYYNKWEKNPNGQLHEGEYIDLFLTSDGMIHDSSSFVIEYLYTNKPVMFLINDDKITDRFNEIGKLALSKLYHGKSSDDIMAFVENVVINSNDSKHDERIHFFNSIVKPPNNVTASENIFNFLKSSIFNDKV